MIVRKTESREWLCELRPNGVQGKQIRKKFATKDEALAYEKFIASELENKPWLGEKQDNRRLSELIYQGYDLHGRTLTDIDRMISKLKAICSGLGNPIAASITVADFSQYREGRLMPISPQTINHEQRYLSAVFGTLKKLGHRSLPNPLSGMPIFNVNEKMVSFLYIEEIRTILSHFEASTSSSVYLVAKICVATGARWSEAGSLESSQETPFRITYRNTKNKKVCSIPIFPEVYDEIPKKRGRLFTPCRKKFERIIHKTGIELPDGQCTHILRHSFARRLMLNGGSMQVLIDVLGHSDIKLTMIYAHFTPHPFGRCYN